MAHNGRPPPSSQSVHSGPHISHQFPIRCTRQEHKPETYFLALTTFVDTRENPEWGRRLERQGSRPCGSSCGSSVQAPGLNRPQNLLLSSWLDGIKISAPDIATWIRRRRKKWCHGHLAACWYCSILLLVPGPEKQICCHANAVNIPRFLFYRWSDGPQEGVPSFEWRGATKGATRQIHGPGDEQSGPLL